MTEEHVDTLKRLRVSVGGEDTQAALTAAIEALEAREAPFARMSTEELRDACEQAARELWGDGSRVRSVLASPSGRYHVFARDVSIDREPDERNAYEQMLAALLVRRAQQGDR